MKIAVDVDDVLVETKKKFIKYINNNSSYSAIYSRLDSFYIENVLGISKLQLLAMLSSFESSSDFGDLRPVKNAQKAIAYLKRHHDLVIVTARDIRHKTITEKLINKYFPHTFSQIYFASNNHNSKARICVKEKINLIIEDHYEYALHCAVREITAILLARPWNLNYKNHHRIVRFNSWSEIIDNIKNYTGQRLYRP